MKTIKNDEKIIARRGLNSISSSILCLLYQVYPTALSTKELSEKLNLRETSIQSSIRKIIITGVPIEKIYNSNKKQKFRASPMEPISWIIKEKDSAQKMLDIISDASLNGNQEANEKKNINNRIYSEYIDSINELFDKWTSLKLFDQLDNKKH